VLGGAVEVDKWDAVDVEGELTSGTCELEVGTETERARGGCEVRGGGEGELDLRRDEISSFAVGMKSGAWSICAILTCGPCYG